MIVALIKTGITRDYIEKVFAFRGDYILKGHAPVLNIALIEPVPGFKPSQSHHWELMCKGMFNNAEEITTAAWTAG